MNGDYTKRIQAHRPELDKDVRGLVKELVNGVAWSFFNQDLEWDEKGDNNCTNIKRGIRNEPI